MQQINVAEKAKIPVDFQRPGMPMTANLLQPVIFKDGDNYCCALGSSAESGVLGFGKTPEQAAQDWDRNLTDRMSLATPGDELVEEIKTILQRHAAEHPASHPPEIKVKEGPPNTATNDRREGEGEGIPSVPPARRNTADQSNADGSE